MNPLFSICKWSITSAVLLASTLSGTCMLFGQSGLRESLERLDTDEDGQIDPDEITPLARPYLERIANARRMSLDRSNDIEKFQEAARIYSALTNGVYGRSTEAEGRSAIQPFGPDPDQPLVPEFGLAEMKYPYYQEDVDEADRTLRRYDWNDDGYIDRTEAKYARWTHRNPFEMDLNQDDRLSRMELTQRYARRRLLDDASGELVKKAWRTGNGIEPSSRRDDERDDRSQWWRSGGSSYYLTASVFSRFDANRNGRLELHEAVSLGIPFGRLDIDRDGELTREELHSFLAELQSDSGDPTLGLPGWFYELDTNRDGQVEMSEFATELTEEKLNEFVAMDLNADALLVPAEVIQSKAVVGGSYRNENAEVLPPRKTIISEIEVSEDYLIGDLNVQLSITHSHVGYLDAYLTGPDGQRVELFTEVGSSGDNFDQSIFDDQSSYPITKARPPYRGAFMPEALVKKQPSLSQFNDKSIKGTWQLVVRGSRNDRFGMLHGWSLIVMPRDDMMESSAAVESAAVVPSPSPRIEYANQDEESPLDSEQAAAKAKVEEIRVKTLATYMEFLKRDDLPDEKRKWLEERVSSGEIELKKSYDKRAGDEKRKTYPLKQGSGVDENSGRKSGELGKADRKESYESKDARKLLTPKVKEKPRIK